MAKEFLHKRLTMLVVPDSDSVSRQLSIRVWVLYASALFIVSLIFASFFLASSFLGDQVNEAELDKLKDQNDKLAEKYEQLRWNLAESEARYTDLVQKEISLRSVFGLPEINSEERLLGIGGPDIHNLSKMTPTQELAYKTEVEVDRLLRLSRFELEQFSQAENGLNKLKDRLDHTPSIWPTKGWNSRGFGQKYDPFTGYKQMHRGIDIANNTGTQIIATAYGRIKSAKRNGGMGKMIVIDHGYGFVSRYGHLSAIDVKRGQRVKRGDVIGKMGSTGYSTGPHLHYEVWRNGKVMNPYKFILNTK